MPAQYPEAIPWDEIRDVARESAATYALCAGLWCSGVGEAPSRGSETDSGSISDAAWSTSRSTDVDAGPADVVSSSCWAWTTSGDARASEGRYAFMATTEAPNPTLAHIARTAERIQRGEEDDRKRKRTAAKAPIKANARRSGFRVVAEGGVNGAGRCTWCGLTAVCDAAHGDDGERLERYGYRVYIEAAGSIRR